MERCDLMHGFAEVRGSRGIQLGRRSVRLQRRWCLRPLRPPGLESASLHREGLSRPGRALRAGPDGRIDDIAGLGILPFSAIYIMKDMSCPEDCCQYDMNR